ncbi:carbohydrate ABC transporter permease [soil metagenome]
MNRDKARKRGLAILKYFVLVNFALWSAVPVVIVILNSFKKQLDIFVNPPSLIFTPTMDNYIRLFTSDDYGRYYLNSIIVTGVSTVLSIVLGLFAAYGLAHFALPTSSKIASGFLFAKMVPPITMLLPLFAVLSAINLLGTYVGPIVAHMAVNLAFVIWLFLSLLRDVPQDIIAAALMDGCTPMQVFWRIIVPVVAPGIAAATILCGQYSWNELLFVLQLTNLDTYTLPVGISKLVGGLSFDWGKSSAAATVTMVPIIIVGFFVQKYIATGTTAGAVKG